MKTILNLAILLLCAAPGNVQTKPSNTQNQSEAEREIRKLTRQWDQAMVKRDVQFLDGILSDDYVISTMAKAQYLQLIKSSVIKYTSFDREIYSVRLYGSTALVLGRANINGQSSPNGWFSSTFRFMDVWIKGEGWRSVATNAEEIIQTSQREKVVKFGPQVKASLVIVLKSGLTDEEVEAFRRDVLQITSSNEAERKYLSGVSQYLRVPAIEKHEAIALTFQDDICKAEREEVMRRVNSSPLVFKVYQDIAPVDIKLSQ
ncbi:MAG TPA: nuclear transport factor 2 family protein [Pyrinomonadaceae bacterium]|nr:nuclear transport factor 2 family protein [Pyrinomonadaceae bacterium]